MVLLVPFLPAAAQPGACDQLTIDHYQSADCDAEMAAAPDLPVRPLEVDEDLLTNYTYLQIITDQPVTVFDAPDGNELYSIAPGFNFVTLLEDAGEWVEIAPGEWLPASALEAVTPSRFAGALFDEPPPRPVGWTVVNMYASKRPDGPPIYDEAHFLSQYSLVSIYATVTVDGLDWYLVGPDQWVKQHNMGIAWEVERPYQVQGRWVAIDLYEQTLVAYENDTLVFATLVSTGITGFFTRTGTFQVWGRRLHGPMMGAEGQPDYYNIANVPFAQYFDGHTSLHGTYWHDGFGYRHSHGCVNLSLTDAHWLYDWLGVEGWVHVYYTRPYDMPSS